MTLSKNAICLSLKICLVRVGEADQSGSLELDDEVVGKGKLPDCR